MMKRPDNLPDFDNPPLNEVVLGVQFSPVKGYKQVYTQSIWELFKDGFPEVEEHPPLPPSLENFGYSPPQINFGLVEGAMHDRFWFLNSEKTELIQFQQDKFIHNWRKDLKETNEYPHFEEIFQKYTDELYKLENYFKEEFNVPQLSLNHFEVSYINFIYDNDLGKLSPNDIFSFTNFESFPDEFACSFNKYLLNEDSTPSGKIICKINKARGPRGDMHKMELTVRGHPFDNSIDGSLKSICDGREKIVNMFAKLTTSKAHELWRKK